MITLALTAIWRRVFFALIALGLVLAPLQMVHPVNAMPSMVMDSGDCVQKPTCCDEGKKDCSQMPGCFAKCGGYSTPAITFPILEPTLAAVDHIGAAAVLEPRATSPPRRPPRI
jgi:hypothetical protein